MISDHSESTTSNSSNHDAQVNHSESTFSNASNHDTQVNHSEVTPCPSSINSHELQDETKWNHYDNIWGSEIFHGGAQGFLENIHPSPEKPQQECFYDKSGDLIDKDHEYSGMRGTANQYDGHHGNQMEQWDHFRHDTGGIWHNFGDSFPTSMAYHTDHAYHDSLLESAVDGISEAYHDSLLESAIDEISEYY